MPKTLACALEQQGVGIHTQLLCGCQAVLQDFLARLTRLFDQFTGVLIGVKEGRLVNAMEQTNTGQIVLCHPQSKVHSFVGRGATVHGNEDFFEYGHEILRSELMTWREPRCTLKPGLQRETV
jgi:hypothetical protein